MISSFLNYWSWDTKVIEGRSEGPFSFSFFSKMSHPASYQVMMLINESRMMSTLQHMSKNHEKSGYALNLDSLTILNQLHVSYPRISELVGKVTI